MDRNMVLGLSVILLISLFAYFSDENNIEYDYSGIVHDIRTSSTGYTFSIDCPEGDLRCYYKDMPQDMGYYSVRGDFSNDHTMFFVKWMTNNDIYEDRD
ncbi:hypothetical protein PED39_02565 [Methanomassiliicoccales archaeon LGM-RCC1]|nr:hypothetical protein PED39_02565 [Methanomassiliicoccales archaeon LGM-RCC1]